METKKRSLVKAIIWRVLVLVMVGGLVYFITGDFKRMTVITLIFESFHTLLYYINERIWARISWGRIYNAPEGITVKEEPAEELVSG